MIRARLQSHELLVEVYVDDYDPERERFHVRHGQLSLWVGVERLIFCSVPDIVQAGILAKNKLARVSIGAYEQTR